MSMKMMNAAYLVDNVALLSLQEKQDGVEFHCFDMGSKVQIAEGQENIGFPKPSSVTSATVCAASGKLPIPGICDGMVKTEYFAEGTVPTKYCDVHVTGEACVESGALATDACPVHEFRVITLIPDDNSVSGSPLVAKPCSLHPGNVLGTVNQPPTDGTAAVGEIQTEDDDDTEYVWDDEDSDE